MHILFFLLLPCLLHSTGMQFYISHVPLSLELGNGTLTNPYTNLIMGISNIMIKIDSLPVPINIDILLLSDYYIIQENDFKTFPKNLSLNNLGNFYLLFGRKNTNLKIYPLSCLNELGKCTSKVEWMVKTSIFGFLSSASLSIYNVKITGRDLKLNFNESCWDKKEGCCSDDAYFYSPGHMCYLTNMDAGNMNIGGVYLYFITVKSGSVTTLTNFELSWFNSLRSGAAFGNFIYGISSFISKLNNVTIVLNEFKMEKAFFFSGFMNLKIQNSSLLVMNSSFNQYYDMIYPNYYTPMLLYMLQLKASDMQFIIIFKNSVISDVPLFLKSSSIDLKMKNVTFTNFRKKYECRSSSSLFFTGIIINSLPEKSLDTSNFTFTDVLINNADSSCYLDNYNWLFSINNNLNIQNLTITAFRSSKISIFKFSYNAYCRISNLTIDQLICRQCTGVIINLVANANMILKDSAFSNIWFSANGLFSGSANSTIMISNTYFSDLNIWEDQDIADPKGIVLFMMDYSYILILNCSFVNINQLNNGGLQYLYGKSVLIIEQTVFNNIYNDKGSILTANYETNCTIINCYFLEIGYKDEFYFNEKSNVLIYLSTFEGLNKALAQGNLENSLFKFNYFCNLTLINNLFKDFDFMSPGKSIFSFQDSSLFITSTIFENLSINSLIYSAGICNADIVSTKFWDLNLEGTLFTHFSQANLNLIYCEFKNLYFNQVKGGVIYFHVKSYIFVNNTKFLNFNLENADGGLLYVYESKIVINSIFIENITGIYSKSLIYLDSTNSLEINDSVIQSISFDSDGGLLFSYYNNIITFQITFIKNIFTSGSGGTFNLQSNNILILNQIFISESKSLNQGGVIFIEISNYIYINQTNIEHVEAKEGGFIFMKNGNSLNMAESRLKWCDAEQSGGFSLNGYDQIFILRSVLLGVRSTKTNGGSFGLVGNIGENRIYIDESYFLNISANDSGGGFSIESNFNKMIFFSNLIGNVYCYDGSGGLFLISQSNQIVLENSTFLNIDSFLQGGLINAEFLNNFLLTQMKAYLISSLESYAGLCYMDSDNEILIENSNILQVKAKLSGGVFYMLTQNMIKISNSSFSDIKSEVSGGLLHVNRRNSIEIRNSSVTSIDALKEGSLLIFLEETNVTLINSNFLNGFKNEGVNFISGGVNSFLQINDSKIDLIFSSIFLSLFQSRLILKNNSFNSNFTTNTVFKFTSVLAYFQISYFQMNILSNFIESESSELKFKRLNLVNKINSNIILKDSQIKIIQSICISISKNRSGFIISDGSEIFIKSSSFSSFSSSNNGGIILCRNTQIIIQMSLFLLNQADISGGVIHDTEKNTPDKKNDISITSSIFFQNKAKSDSAVLFYNCISSDCPSSLLLQRSNFRFSRSNIGSNLYLENTQKFSFLENKFISSIALANPKFTNLSKGGAFYFKNLDPRPKLFWSKNNFERNFAESGGAIYLELPNFNKIETSNYDSQENEEIKFNNFESIYIDNFFSLDKASFFGDNAASNIQNLVFLGKDLVSTKKEYMKDLVSGAQYNSCILTLGGVDLFGNIAYMTDEEYLERVKIEMINGNNLTNSLDYSLENGLICFKGVFKRLQLPIKSDFIYKIWLEGGKKESYLQLKLSFRDCILGEILTENFECQPCEEGTFSFQRDFFVVSEKCQLCLESNPFNCLGGNDLRPRAGFWRLSNDSTNFLKCRDIEACIDGMALPLFNCATGYSGMLCDECQEGYGHTSYGVCAKCEGMSVGEVFSILLRLFIVIFSLINSYQMVCSICSSDLSHNEVIVTNMLKTLVNHIQILLLIQEFPSLLPPSLLPSSILTLFSLLLSISPNMSEGLSTECLTRSFGIRMPYLKMIFCFVYPIIILLLGIVFILLMHCIKGEKMKFHIKRLNMRRNTQKNLSFSYDRPSLLSPSFSPDKLMIERNSEHSSKKSQPILIESEENAIPFLWVIATTFISIIILVFPDLLKIFLQIFCCVNVSDTFSPEMRLDVDLKIKCENNFSSEKNASYIIWRNYLGVPGLGLVGFFVPIFLVSRMGLAYKRNELKERKVMFIYGFFYYAYKEEFFYWDLMIWLRKFLMMFINIFYMKVLEDKRDLSPILLIFAILIISCILHFECQPFETKYNVVNNFESFSLIVLAITIFATTFLFSQTIFGEPTITARLTILSIILIANLFFFLYFLVNIYVYNLKIRLNQLKRLNILEKLKMARSKFSKNSSVFLSRMFNNKTEGRKSPPKKFSMKFSRFSQPNPIRLTIIEKNRKILKKRIKSFLFCELQRKRERFNLLKIENAFLADQAENKDNLCLIEKNLKNNFLQNFTFEDIPQEKGEEDKFEIRIRGNERSFFLACLKNRERVVLLDDKVSRIECQSWLCEGEEGDYFVKVILEIKLKKFFQNVEFDVIDDEDYGIYFKEKMNLVGLEEEPNYFYDKVFKIFARLDTIPLKVPKAKIEIMNINSNSESIVEILLPICLYKFMIFSHKKMDELELECLSKFEYKKHTIKKIKGFRNLKEIHNFFPNSFYYKRNEKICENKDGFLILKGKLVFYPEYEICTILELETEGNRVTAKVFHGNSKQKILALLVLDELVQIIQTL